MPYSPTTWVEGVTTLGPTNLNHIEQGIVNVGTGSGLPAQLQPLIGAPPGNDMNNIVASGWYSCSGSAHAPPGAGGYAQAITDSSTYQVQTYYDVPGSGSATNLVYTRTQISGTWSAWARVAPPGGTSLVYRYTVTGSSKASIDTGTDTPDAGSNDWTNGDLLEIFIYSQTDDTGAAAVLIDGIVNNDTASGYDTQEVVGSATTASADTFSTNHFRLLTHGNASTTGYAGVIQLSFPNYSGTTFYKTGSGTMGTLDNTIGNQRSNAITVGWRNTAAITRFKIACESTNKFLVGTQLLIYKRLAS